MRRSLQKIRGIKGSSWCQWHSSEQDRIPLKHTHTHTHFLIPDVCSCATKCWLHYRSLKSPDVSHVWRCWHALTWNEEFVRNRMCRMCRPRRNCPCSQLGSAAGPCWHNAGSWGPELKWCFCRKVGNKVHSEIKMDEFYTVLMMSVQSQADPVSYFELMNCKIK